MLTMSVDLKLMMMMMMTTMAVGMRKHRMAAFQKLTVLILRMTTMIVKVTLNQYITDSRLHYTIVLIFRTLCTKDRLNTSVATSFRWSTPDYTFEALCRKQQNECRRYM